MTRIQLAQEEHELAHRLAADESIMAAATKAERRVFTVFKFSMLGLLGLIGLTLFFPAMMLADLVLLCVAAVYGSRWMSTRDAIAVRIERSRRQAAALARTRG